MEYPNSTFKHKYNSAVHYIAECLLAKRKKWFKDSPNKLVVITAIPLGYLLYLYILIKG